MNLRLNCCLVLISIFASACATTGAKAVSLSVATEGERTPSSLLANPSIVLVDLIDVHLPKYGAGITYVYKTNGTALLEITCAIDVTLSRAMIVSVVNGPTASLAFRTRKDCNAMAGLQAGLVNTGTPVIVSLSNFDGDQYRNIVFSHPFKTATPN